MRVAALAVVGVACLACRQVPEESHPDSVQRAPRPIQAVNEDEELGFWMVADASGGSVDGTTAEDCKMCVITPPRSRVTIEQHIRSIAIPAPPSTTTGECTEASPDDVCAVDATATPSDAKACADALLRTDELGRVDGTSVRLTRRGAKLAVASARGMELELVALDLNHQVAAIAGAAATAAVLEDDPETISLAAPWCERLRDALSQEDQDPAEVGRSLSCLSRVAAGIEHSLYPSWEGCACGERGLLVGTVCVEAWSVARPFPRSPVDARFREALAEAAERADVRLSTWGLQLEGLGLVGCHIARLERGGDVRSLAEARDPRLALGAISDHTTGVACDLIHAWFDDDSGFAVEQLYWALLDMTGKQEAARAQKFGRDGLTGIRDSGEATWFRGLDQTLSPTLDNATLRALAIGATLRTALTDAGFIVYTTITNSAHKDHFHFFLPDDETLWRTVSDDATTAEDRDALVQPLLRRAGGQ